MNEYRIELDRNPPNYRPGEKIKGKAVWKLDKIANLIEIKLFWYTSGKGDRDISIEYVIPIFRPPIEGEKDFEIQLPDGPYSFSGQLISVIWALELLISDEETAFRQEIIVGPEKQEVLLHLCEENIDEKIKDFRSSQIDI